MECSIVGGHPRFLEQQAYSGTTKSFSFIQVPSQIFLCSFLFFGGGWGWAPPNEKEYLPQDAAIHLQISNRAEHYKECIYFLDYVL